MTAFAAAGTNRASRFGRSARRGIRESYRNFRGTGQARRLRALQMAAGRLFRAAAAAAPWCALSRREAGPRAGGWAKRLRGHRRATRRPLSCAAARAAASQPRGGGLRAKLAAGVVARKFAPLLDGVAGLSARQPLRARLP